MGFEVYKQTPAFYKLAVVNMLQRYGEHIMKIGFISLFFQLLNKEQCDNLFIKLSAIIYLTCILGGFFSDKFLGKRKSILYAVLLQTICIVLLCVSFANKGHLDENWKNLLQLFLIGLFALSSGLFKPSIYSQLSSPEMGADKGLQIRCTLFYFFSTVGVYAAVFTVIPLDMYYYDEIRAHPDKTILILVISGIANIILLLLTVYKHDIKKTAHEKKIILSNRAHDKVNSKKSIWILVVLYLLFIYMLHGQKLLNLNTVDLLYLSGIALFLLAFIYFYFIPIKHQNTA